MKAWTLIEKKTPELLVLQDVPKPQPGFNEVLIQVKATSLNPVDYKVTQGAFNLPVPICVGIDAALMPQV